MHGAPRGSGHTRGLRSSGSFACHMPQYYSQYVDVLLGAHGVEQRGLCERRGLGCR